MRAAETVPATPPGTLWRTLQTFCVTRIVIAAVLLIFLLFSGRGGPDPEDQLLHWETCLAYLVIAIGFAVAATYFRRHFLLHLATQVAADIGAISMLYLVAGGAKSGLAILYLFPLSGSAILAPLIPALFFAALVTLVVLAVSGYQILQAAADVSMLQAGLYGAAFFAAVLVINRLAAKLIKQENLAVQRGHDLQVQEAINRLVIADMDDGLLVIGMDTKILACNPAAERMLGLVVPSNGGSSEKLSDFPSLGPIADAFFAWNARSNDIKEPVPGSAYVMVKPADDATTIHSVPQFRDSRRDLGSRLKIRFVSVRAAGLAEDRVVVYLQDVTSIENQAQQLKLASMGRLTASVAHEVRNPLSAISHAASLLGEEISGPAEARLLKIVGDNVSRLNRLIEDILKLSRRAQPNNVPIALAGFFEDVLEEFRGTHAIREGVIRVGNMKRHQVRFDPMHLREIIVNLLSNALRYASGKDGSIRMRIVGDTSSRLELHVQDDGPGIRPEVRAHLFEPFYTTSSKGTGLGLYVARELCLNNGAMLDYEYRVDDARDGLQEPTGRFVVTFAMPEAG